MELSMIAAVGKGNELGKNNELIWNIPNDLKFFKEKTIGKTVVMGANTFHSIGKPLPKRTNIVITQNIDKVLIYRSIREFLIDYKNKTEEVFIIGGASIYKEFIDYASKLYLTEIDASDKEADTYFPEFDKDLFDDQILLEGQEENIPFVIHEYSRKLNKE